MLRVIKIENQQDLNHAFKIRKEVFVVEQKVDERIEYEFEEESTHFLALMDDMPVGTARWRKTEKGIKLERFAVLKDYRSARVGSALLQALLADIPNGTKLYLHAQLSAMGLYAKFGFKPEGDLFVEADIEHYKMTLAH